MLLGTYVVAFELLFFTRISYQIRRINWLEINSYLQDIRLLFSKDFSTIISLEYFLLSYTAKGEK
jgi:hypothetical protein